MDASTQFHDAVSGQYTIAGPQASHGGSNNFHFYGPRAPSDPAERNPPKPRKPFSTVPFPPDANFVDRPDILKWMHEKCARPAARIALVGLGGIGQRSPNTWVFWVHASTRGRFEESYQSIADRLELPRRSDPDINVLRLVSEWLRVEENGPWEMIVDNADDADVFFSIAQGRLASFLTQSCHGSIVVTSRSIDVAERLVGGRSNLFVIPAMERDEACQLLQRKLGLNHDNGTAADLVRVLDYMPLAITQAAAFINRRAPRMSTSKYLDEFQRSDKKRASLLNREAGDLRRDESASNSIVATWQITFDQIRRERPSAADLLSFMSFFNPQGIPEWTLQAYACDHGPDGEGDLDEDLDEDLETLRGYSLVAVTADSESFEMHALVQFCTRVWLSSFCDTQSLLGSVLRYQGKYEEAEQMNRRALEGHEKVLGREHPHTLGSISNLGLVLQYQGKYEEAEQMHRRALEARERVLGREHPDTLASVGNLGLVLQYQGEYEEAEQMNRRALEGHKKVLGREHPDTLMSVGNLGLVLQYQGKYEEAEPMHRRALESNLGLVLQYQGKYEEAEPMNRRALEGYEKVLGREHPHTLTSVSNLGLVLQYQGKYEEAEQMSRRAVEGYEKVLGREHPDTLTSVSNLGSVLQYQGKYEEAEPIHRRALEASEKVLGRDHPDTLASIYHLAYLLHRQARFSDAGELYERACNGYVKALGSDHPTTRACMANRDSLRKDMANQNAQTQ
ncbi:NACHT domain-containing protein [Fusarium keratoplasticum]|nr:NACHT domain-containing protein [Fusarium keratoplasticum]